MSERLRSYSAARGIFSFLEFTGWATVLLGLVVGAVLAASAGRYASDTQKWLLFAMGASGSLVGLFYVGAVQGWRASVDAAEYGQQALKIARDQLAISRQGLKLQTDEAQTFADMKTATMGENVSSYDKVGQSEVAPTMPKTKKKSTATETQKIQIGNEKIKVPKPKPPKDPLARIEEKDGRFLFGTMSFSTRDRAEEYASQFGVNPKLEQ